MADVYGTMPRHRSFIDMVADWTGDEPSEKWRILTAYFGWAIVGVVIGWLLPLAGISVIAVNMFVVFWIPFGISLKHEIHFRKTQP